MKAGVALTAVIDSLARLERQGEGVEYSVPRFVLEPTHSTAPVNVGNPYTFFRSRLTSVVTGTNEAQPRTGLRDDDVLYLTFLRSFAALNGEIGTPLKQIIFLPHLQRLGVTVVLSLPTGVIGVTNRKGTRGSPFAVQNPFAVDASLVDQLLPDVGAATQYRAMVDAFELASIRCGSIVPLATHSIDSPLIAQFPSITYWWNQPFGHPLRAALIDGQQGAGLPDRGGEIDPTDAQRFSDPPARISVSPVSWRGQTFWRGTGGLTPASACPDVVASDGTYSWADVAGVRYGTSSIPDLGPFRDPPDPTHRAVQIMALSVAWRAAVLGERVFWVDVAERVPDVVLAMASQLLAGWTDQSRQLCSLLGTDADPDAIERLLDRVIADRPATGPAQPLTFIAEELFSFDTEGDVHDVVVGPWVFCVGPFTHDLRTLRESMRHHLGLLAATPPRKLFLAGLGDHDSIPPLPDLVPALLAATFLLPRSVPFLFSGIEHEGQQFVNKEFGFNTTPALLTLRDELDDDTLALFNDIPFDWHGGAQSGRVMDAALGSLALRQIAQTFDLKVMTIAPTSGDVIGYIRSGGGNERLAVYLNSNPTERRSVAIDSDLAVIFTTTPIPASPSSHSILMPPFTTTVVATPSIRDASQSESGH